MFNVLNLMDISQVLHCVCSLVGSPIGSFFDDIVFAGVLGCFLLILTCFVKDEKKILTGNGLITACHVKLIN